MSKYLNKRVVTTLKNEISYSGKVLGKAEEEKWEGWVLRLDDKVNFCIIVPDNFIKNIIEVPE